MSLVRLSFFVVVTSGFNQINNVEANCQNGNGEDYSGSVSNTKSGFACQKWSERKTLKYTSVGDHNYCRNPDGEPGVWCFSTNLDELWELCDVPVCIEGVYLIQSSGGAAQYQANRMGRYTHNGDSVEGYPVYEKDGEYLYVNPLGSWMVGPDTSATAGGLYHKDNQPTPNNPPLVGWRYSNNGFHDDNTLTVSQIDGDKQPLGYYLIQSSGGAAQYQANRMGRYTHYGDIVASYPVYENNGQYLYVNPNGHWMVGPDTSSSAGGMFYPDLSGIPPLVGWKYSKIPSLPWQDDNSLTVTPGDCYEKDTDYSGNDVNPDLTKKRNSPSECQALCQQTHGCQYFTWSAPFCWLKSKGGVGQGRYLEGAISGPKICTAIDGVWTSFGACTETCKGGVKTRTCTNPPPQHGGKPCTGDASVPCNQNIDCSDSCCEKLHIKSKIIEREDDAKALGLYFKQTGHHDGKPVYLQPRRNGYYLFYKNGKGWLISNLGTSAEFGVLHSLDITDCPTTVGTTWHYNEGINNVIEDSSLEFRCKEQIPCYDGFARREAMSHSNNPDECKEKCLNDGYKYAGVVWTSCMCGDEEPPISRIRDGSECDIPCPGDRTENCGGLNRVNVLETGALPQLGEMEKQQRERHKYTIWGIENEKLLKEFNLVDKRMVRDKTVLSTLVEIKWSQFRRCYKAVTGCSEEYYLVDYYQDGNTKNPVFKVHVAKTNGISVPDEFRTNGHNLNHQLHFGFHLFGDENTPIINLLDLKGAIFFVIHPEDWKPYQKRFKTHFLMEAFQKVMDKGGDYVGDIASNAALKAYPINNSILMKMFKATVKFPVAYTIKAFMNQVWGNYLRPVDASKPQFPSLDL